MLILQFVMGEFFKHFSRRKDGEIEEVVSAGYCEACDSARE